MKNSNTKTNKKFIIIFATLLIVGGGYGIYKYLHGQAHEITDDAQIEKNISPVVPKVGGYVNKVYVKDNDIVKKGDTLFVIDNKDYLVKLEEAKAAYIAAQDSYEASKADIGTAEATVSVSDANVKSATENIESAKIRLTRATNDFDRYANLYKNHSITKQQYEQAEATKLEAQTQLRILQEQQKASSFQKKVASNRTNVTSKQTKVALANISRAKASVDAAQLNVNYTVVVAPYDGQVSKINVQPGQFIQPGQSLFYIIGNHDMWVVANFKETQLNKMLEGQEVKIHVDAFPDDEFEGKIVSFSPATGAKFSILPPDNATGNFVKTIQRLPVKISFTEQNDKNKLSKLRPGMNVTVDVHTK